MRDRTFKAIEAQRSAARRELQDYIDALCHDAQYDIRRACRILEILALPERLTRDGQLEELEKQLALRREQLQWGRPWTVTQLRRAFYANAADFRRTPPKPVTKAELIGYEPIVPPLQRRKAERPAGA